MEDRDRGDRSGLNIDRASPTTARRGEYRALLTAIAIAVAGAAGWSLWRQHEGDRLAQRIAAKAQAGDIRMLSSTTCPHCASARAWMTRHGVRFDECFIERDASCAQAYQATGARGTPTMWVKGEVQLGFDARRVELALSAPSAAVPAR